METRARKRVRVADYEYDDEVAERTTKRIKKEKKVKQEIKNEPKIKPEPSNNNIKSEKKSIKSEVKSEVKIELKKEKKEKKIKLEANLKIKTEPGVANETTDQDDGSSEEDNEERSNDQSAEVAEVSDESEQPSADDENKDDDAQVKQSEGRYDFDSFKTIVLPKKASLRWTKATNQTQQKITNEIIEKIFTLSEVPEIMIWARVSKSTSNLVNGSQSMWQKLFRKQHWHLPHEIRNKNFRFQSSKKRFPLLKISDKEVDWFNEFKRNFTACSAIRRKLEIVHKLYNAKYPKFKDIDKSVDEETIQEWEEDNEHFLSNDLREYYKTSQISLTEDLSEVRECTVTLFRVYRKKKPSDASDEEEDEFAEDDTVTDLRSVSKLLDIPESNLKDDITGILIMDITRNGGTVFVPYINMFFEIDGDEPAYFAEDGEQTVLQMIEDRIKHLKE